MFDVGFFQVIIVCIVALIVLGPDKLPGTIRTVGLWVGRLKRSFNNIKAEIEKEVGADEIKRQLRNEEIMEKIKKTKGQFTKTIDSVKEETASVASSLKPEGLDDLKKDIDTFTGKTKPAAETTPDDKAEPESPTETSQTESEKPAVEQTASSAKEPEQPADTTEKDLS